MLLVLASCRRLVASTIVPHPSFDKLRMTLGYGLRMTLGYSLRMTLGYSLRMTLATNSG